MDRGIVAPSTVIASPRRIMAEKSAITSRSAEPVARRAIQATLRGPTSAQSASQRAITERRTPPIEEVSPLLPDIFNDSLTIYGLHAKYPDLLRSLIHGFELGSPMPSVPFDTPYLPNNHYKTDAEEAFVTSYFEEQVSAGQMIGPYSIEDTCSILGVGAFYCSPIATVPKAGSEEFRVVRNMSFGDAKHPSPNSFMNKEDFCFVEMWTTPNELELWVSLSLCSLHSLLSLPRRVRLGLVEA